MERRSARHAIAVLCLATLACGGGTPPGTVGMGDVMVNEGTIDASYLAVKLNSVGPTLEACYARALRHQRDAEGTIALQLEGRGNDVVPTIQSNTTGNDDLGGCVRNAVEGLTFPESEGYVPFEFRAEWPLEFAVARRR